MKKVLNTIKNVFVWVFVIFTLGMMLFTIVSVSTFDRNDRDLLGYKAFIVQSDSMSATDFDAGDLIFVKEVPMSELKEGDIISFISRSTESFGETITHKIDSKTVDENGRPGFITYGTTTGIRDDTVVTESYILGKYTGKIEKMGFFFQFLKSTPGYICCILIPALILIGYQGWNCVKLFRLQRQEHREQMQRERDEIAAERAKAEETLRQLQELQRQLSQQQSKTPEEE